MVATSNNKHNNGDGSTCSNNKSATMEEQKKRERTRGRRTYLPTTKHLVNKIELKQYMQKMGTTRLSARWCLMSSLLAPERRTVNRLGQRERRGGSNACMNVREIKKGDGKIFCCLTGLSRPNRIYTRKISLPTQAFCKVDWLGGPVIRLQGHESSSTHMSI